MSSFRPSSAVSQITGRVGGLTTANNSSGSICPVPKLACRSAPEPAASRESLQCTRSMRPVMLMIRFRPRRRAFSPAAQAWAGVQTEADALVADVVPQAGDGVEVPGHRVVAARVFSRYQNRGHRSVSFEQRG